MKADSVTSVSLPRMDIYKAPCFNPRLTWSGEANRPDQPIIDRKPMIHYAEMGAQAGLILGKKWLPRAVRTTAALQEDTPLKKHRLVLFSVSDSKDAPF